MARNAEIYHLERHVEQLNNVVNELLIENNDLKERILENYDAHRVHEWEHDD